MENFDINNLNRTIQESYIHYEPNRIDYTINESELLLLEESGKNFWKDIFFVCLGLCIPSLLNAIVCKHKLPDGWNDEIFYNTLLGSLTLILCLISAFLWFKTGKKLSTIVNQIKNKPKYKIPGSK